MVMENWRIPGEMSGKRQRLCVNTEAMKQKLPRLMLAAPSSGSGKTLITCGILMALKERGMKASSFKCGPDYIDPLFHQEVLGIPSRNLDTFFTDGRMTRYLFGRAARNSDISILEGVMGYYDGAGGNTTLASSYELADITDTPVVLIINTKGMSLSALPVIQGFLNYKGNSHIKGVILNQVSPGIYERLKEKIEQELSIEVLGYVPKCPELVIKSRHLGLVMPKEVEQIQHKLVKLSELLEKTLDMERLLACAQEAPALNVTEPEILKDLKKRRKYTGIAIGAARDEAFCFFYQDNLELILELGAEILYFSPLHDRELPKNLNGLLLYGGYPELYAEQLNRNDNMRREIKNYISQGMPYLAECGGFLYLQESMEDMEGTMWEMAGIFPGKAYRTNQLGRFGYMNISANNHGQLLKQGSIIRGHEYHYFDCTENGRDYRGRKPLGVGEWDCVKGGKSYAAGFPHLYYYSNPEFITEFLHQCQNYKDIKEGRLKNEIERVPGTDSAAGWTSLPGL